MFFFNIWKSDEKKYSSRFFQICKHAFFNIWKSDEQKIVSQILRFVSMLFFNIWKVCRGGGGAGGCLGFVWMLFMGIVTLKNYLYKMVIKVFSGF